MGLSAGALFDLLIAGHHSRGTEAPYGIGGLARSRLTRPHTVRKSRKVSLSSWYFSAGSQFLLWLPVAAFAHLLGERR